MTRIRRSASAVDSVSLAKARHAGRHSCARCGWATGTSVERDVGGGDRTQSFVSCKRHASRELDEEEEEEGSTSGGDEEREEATKRGKEEESVVTNDERQ